MSDEVSLSKGWSLESYVSANESLRAADKELQKERDQRYQERFAAQEKAVEAALTSAKEAVLKAEHASEKRFESVNEFRATLADQSATLITRNEVEQRSKAIDEKVGIIMSRMDRLEGRTGGMDASWLKLVSAIGMAGALIAIVAAILKWG